MKRRNRQSRRTVFLARPFLTAAGSETKRLDFAAPLDITAAQGDTKRPSFKIKAYTGGPLQTAFSYYPAVLDLTGGKVAGKNIPILIAHDEMCPFGQSDEVTIDDKGVSLSGIVTGEDPESQNILAHAKNGFLWQASVGVKVGKTEFLEAGATASINGQKVKGPLVLVRDWTLMETSVVTIGADRGNTTVKIAAKGNSEMNPFQKWLAAKGIKDFDALPEGARTDLQAAFDATQEEVPADPDPAKPGMLTAADVERMITAAVGGALKASNENHERNAAIERHCGTAHPEIRAKALAEKWTADQVELAVLRASRPTAPGGIIRGASPASAEVLTAALCQTGKLVTLEREFKPEVLQAAHTRYKGRAGLQQILLEAAWQGGYTGSHFDKSASGLQDILRAAFSTVSLPGIMSNVANKFMLQGFMGVDQSWRAISATRNVNDFKQVTSYRLTGAMEFVEVGPTGELEHGQVGEDSFTNQARTYGIMLAITRRDQINDDLGALTEVPKRIGRGGALKFNTVFWAKFLADASTFFTAGRLNYISGATTSLTIAGLTQAQTKFLRQVDQNGKPLGLLPAWLLVPPELAVAAQEIMKATTVNTGGASTTEKVPNSNVFSGRFPPVVSPYLTDADQWYLGASPNDLPMIEAAFLNGVEQPTIETANADFDTLGIQMRGFLDFGVEKQEYRAVVKSKGKA